MSATPSAVPPSRRPAVPVAVTTLVLGILIGLGVLFAWRRSTAGSAAAGDGGAARIAVLPFENLGDTADAYFAAGVSDAVRGKLTELSQLQVIARGSSVQYAGSTRTPAQIAADLGVQYLLTGTVRWARGADGTSRVQVSPELVQVSGEGAAASKWQQAFEAPLTDVFKLQADIAGRVAQAMRVALPGAAQHRLAEAPTSNPAAYDALLRARAATNYRASVEPARVRRAIRYYQEAVKLDSSFALAWAEMSTAMSSLYANSTPLPELGRQAREAAERAVRLDPKEVAGYRARALYYVNVEPDPVRAAAEMEAAVRQAPGDVTVIGTLGGIYRSAGRWEEALEYSRRSLALDPLSALRAGGVADDLLWMRRADEALPAAGRARALAPDDVGAIQRVVMVHLARGDLAGARQVLAGATDVDQAALAAYMSLYWDLGWVLDDAAQRLALSLPAEAFDGDPASLGLVRMQLHAWRGDMASSRAWADSALRYVTEQLRASPDEPQRTVFRGLALAYLGRAEEATAAGERSVSLLPVSKEAQSGAYYVHQLVRIYIHVGRHDQALDRLEQLLAIPYYVTPAWLRIDPEFAPLRGNPRFERLAGGTA